MRIRNAIHRLCKYIFITIIVSLVSLFALSVLVLLNVFAWGIEDSIPTPDILSHLGGMVISLLTIAFIASIIAILTDPGEYEDEA